MLVFCWRSAIVRISDNSPDWKWGSTPLIVNHSAKAIITIIIIVIIIITTVLIRCTSGCTSVILIKIHRTRDVCLQKGTHGSKHSKVFGKQVFWKSRHVLWNIPLEKSRLEFCYFIYNKLIWKWFSRILDRFNQFAISVNTWLKLNVHSMFIWCFWDDLGTL